MHRHLWRITFITVNIHAREKWPNAYWYVFTCHDWRCQEKRTIARDKFWQA